MHTLALWKIILLCMSSYLYVWCHSNSHAGQSSLWHLASSLQSLHPSDSFIPLNYILCTPMPLHSSHLSCCILLCNQPVKVVPHFICRTVLNHQISFLNLVCEEKIPHIQCLWSFPGTLAPILFVRNCALVILIQDVLLNFVTLWLQK